MAIVGNLTSSLLGQLDKLLPSHLVAYDNGITVPFGEVECFNNKLCDIARVCERHKLLSISGDRGPLVSHVDDKCGLLNVRLHVGHSIVFQEPSKVDSSPFEVRLLQFRISGRVLIAMGKEA